MKKIIAILLPGFVFSACSRFDRADEKQDVQQRLVCISKQYSEILYALGAQQNLVAVDLSSTYPPEIKKLPTVGYHRALSLEAITAMKPDLVLQDDNIGPEHVVKQLEDLKIPMKKFGKYSNTPAGTDSLIREMGAYFQRPRQADSLCATLHKEVAAALEKKAHYHDSLKVIVIHFGQASNVYLTMTSKGTAAAMIRMAGGYIPVTGKKGMEPLSAELITQSDPDVILLTDVGYDRLGDPGKIKELPGVAGTRAAKNNKIYRIEEHDLVYMGPRTGENVLRIQQLIHQP